MIFKSCFCLEQAFQDCITKTIQKLYSSEETLLFINFSHFPYNLNVTNPRILFTYPLQINKTINFYNYVVLIDEIQTREKMQHFTVSHLWNPSQTPRGNFLLIAYSKSAAKKALNVLWNFDARNLLFIVLEDDEDINLYGAESSDVSTKCSVTPRLNFLSSCNTPSPVRFPKSDKFTGCTIKFIRYSTQLNATSREIQALFEIISNSLKVIKKALDVNITAINNDEIAETLYNRSKDITVFPTFSRKDSIFYLYDISNCIYQDEFVWITPKSIEEKRLLLIGQVYETKIWVVVLIIFGITIIVWWALSIRGSELESFRDFFRCCLTIVVVTLGGSSNILPKSKPLNVLLISYLIYCLQMNTALQSKLISILMSTSYGRPITSIDQFAQVDLPIISHPHIIGLLENHTQDNVLTKILRKSKVVKPMDSIKNLHHVAYDRNCSTFLSKAFLNNYPVEKEMIDVIYSNVGLLPLECSLCLRKGHYFLKKLNTVLSRILESGIQQRFKVSMDGVLGKVDPHDSNNSSKVSLALKHLYGVFIWYIIGIIISLMVFVGEICYYYKF